MKRQHIVTLDEHGNEAERCRIARNAMTVPAMPGRRYLVVIEAEPQRRRTTNGSGKPNESPRETAAMQANPSRCVFIGRERATGGRDDGGRGGRFFAETRSQAAR